jgi:hypothetical protein
MPVGGVIVQNAGGGIEQPDAKAVWKKRVANDLGHAFDQYIFAGGFGRGRGHGVEHPQFVAKALVLSP